LLRALDLAERTGAATLAAEVRQELLAADGRSNRQIAEHLFVTQATVETHLRHAFRKLGITSRAALPGRLST
jgi:DNA-binding CsgD family transcriptional regulator